MRKRSLTIAGHRTSVALEEEFWTEIDTLAAQREQSLTQFIESIDQNRQATNLASALRLTVLQHLKRSNQ